MRKLSQNAMVIRNLILILIVICSSFKSLFGQFVFDPIRFGYAKYFEIDYLKSINKSYHDNFIDFHINVDSLFVILTDTTFYIHQKKYERTKKNKRLLFFYFQKRKFSDRHRRNGIIIDNCKIIELKDDNIYCLCRVLDTSRMRSKVRRREVVFQTNQINGVILGLGKTPRIVLISLGVLNLMLHSHEIKNE
jgi:hypothetical protein